MASKSLKVLLAGFTVLGASATANTKHLGPNTTISFEAKSAQLTQVSKDELSKIATDARAHGKIDEVQVAVWSDNPAPRKGEKLSDADRKLADQRAKAIKDYLKKPLNVGDVDTFNMADRASWLARTFDTDEAQLKAEIGRGGDGVMSKEEFQIFRDGGKPSKAVLLIRYED